MGRVWDSDKTYYYQTDFRFYDPQRAQWGDIDLLASEMASVSPMSFSNNNPMSFNDPTGLLPFNMSVGQFVGSLAGMITGGIGAYSAAKNNGASNGHAILAGFGGAVAGGAIGYGLGSIDYKGAATSSANFLSSNLSASVDGFKSFL